MASSAPDALLGFESVEMALAPIVALGLVGYGWRVRFARRWVWKVVFCAELIGWFAVVLLGVVLVGLSAWWLDLPAVEEPWSTPLFAAVLGVELLKPYILFQYAFREDATWQVQSIPVIARRSPGDAVRL